MSGEQKGSPSKNKQDLRGGFGLERCPNPACGQVFYEKSQDYWRQAPEKILCGTCEREAVFLRIEFSSDAMHRITYSYWCHFCKEESPLTIPLDRKYCGVCKTVWYRSWSFHLRAPLPPEDPANPSIPFDLPGNIAKEEGDRAKRPSKAKITL